MNVETDFQLQVLKDFATAENKKLEAKLEEILDDVGKTGQYIFPWHFMKPLYAHKLDKVTAEFLDSTPPLNVDGSPNLQEIEKLKEFRQELLQSFDKFVCAPFTLQRVTELLNHPKKHYKSTAKYFRGLEKNIMVVSTMSMVTAEQRNLLKRQRKDSTQTENGIEHQQVIPPIKRVASTGIILSGILATTAAPGDLNVHDTSCQVVVPTDEKQKTTENVAFQGDEKETDGGNRNLVREMVTEMQGTIKECVREDDTKFYRINYTAERIDEPNQENAQPSTTIHEGNSDIDKET